MVRKHQIDLVIGAGGASIMDCAKLIALGSCHEDFWEYVKGRKNPYGLKKLPLVLMPEQMILALHMELRQIMRFWLRNIPCLLAGK